ncbi:MAG TPA: Cof-type HAD-IIB family hydrolase [Candidatus Dormibacteraeota bacterium]|nr:Cof-type HAD-IIB family hydrolase [Candidatus Dormibacteraeota bacterium]
MRPRLLISDLDGTLLDERLQIDPRDVVAVALAHQEGIRVGIATGRMYRSALPHALALGADLPLICYQGAQIQELAQGGSEPEMAAAKVLRREEVPGELGLEVLALCRRRGFALNVYQDDHLYVDRVDDDVRFYTGIAQVTAEVAGRPTLEDRVRRGSTKLTVVARDRDRFQAALAELQELLGGRAEVTRSLIGFCEITAPGVNKGKALNWLCRQLGVDPGDVVAVGDAPNDLPLLEAAGTRVAVETASEEVRQAADWLIPGPGQGGLTELVRRVLSPAGRR